MSGIFDPSVYIKTVTIVGCGGTGAAAARIVARILYDMRRSRKHTPQLVLVDHDCVEEKNIGRQALFAPSDIGKFKAACIAQRLNYALGLNIAYIPEPVNATQHFDRYSGNLVISCVDNYEARREIHRINGILIGSGNHTDSGQVCIGNCDDPDLMRRFINGRDSKYPYLPKEGLLFPELLQPETIEVTPAPSCGELVEAGEQSLLINDWQSTVIGSYVYKLLHRQPITSFLTYISMGDFPSVRSVPICSKELVVFL